MTLLGILSVQSMMAAKMNRLITLFLKSGTFWPDWEFLGLKLHGSQSPSLTLSWADLLRNAGRVLQEPV